MSFLMGEKPFQLFFGSMKDTKICAKYRVFRRANVSIEGRCFSSALIGQSFSGELLR